MMFNKVILGSIATLILTGFPVVQAFVPHLPSMHRSTLLQAQEQQDDDADDIASKKELIRSTWAMADEALGVKATQLFYQRLFEQYPSVKPLFANANMETQASHLHQTIDLAVKSLDDSSTLVPILQALGARHATKYQTELPHYSAVGETLLWTLEQGLGPDVWTPQVAEAWTWVYGVIADTMAQGATEATATATQDEAAPKEVSA